MDVTLVSYTPNPLHAIEAAASVCYDSPVNAEGKTVRHCYLSGHHSVLEHASFTWEIRGVSRALLAQITRHRLASFCVQSQRYVSYEGGFDYVIPRSLISTEDREAFRNQMATVQQWYREWLEKGLAPEDARAVLPNACCTTLRVTMNLREFVHFCNERLCACAQKEIRTLCKLMVQTVNQATDNAFAYMLVPKCEAHPNMPFCTESKRRNCGKYPTLKEIYTAALQTAKPNAMKH